MPVMGTGRGCSGAGVAKANVVAGGGDIGNESGGTTVWGAADASGSGGGPLPARNAVRDGARVAVAARETEAAAEAVSAAVDNSAGVEGGGGGGGGWTAGTSPGTRPGEFGVADGGGGGGESGASAEKRAEEGRDGVGCEVAGEEATGVDETAVAGMAMAVRGHGPVSRVVPRARSAARKRSWADEAISKLRRAARNSRS